MIPPYYDSMVAKLIVRGSSYALAVRKLRRALHEFDIRGVHTTLPFLRNICDDRAFRRGYFDTSYIEKKLPELMPEISHDPSDLVAAIVVALAARTGM